MPDSNGDNGQAADHSDGSSSNGCTRVRVLPGSNLALPTPPSPPQTPPPKPSHLCKIAIVGDHFAGKTTLVHKFVHRRYASQTNNSSGESSCRDDGGGISNGGASATYYSSNSIGTSLGATTYDSAVEPTSSLAEYHKKDVAIWDTMYGKKPQSIADGNNGEHEQKPVCIRVQLWDMNIDPQFTSQQQQQQQQHETSIPEDNLSIQSIASDLGSLNRATTNNIAPLLPLLKRVHGIMIVCRCPLSPSHSHYSHSSNASYSSHVSNASCSEWPELDGLEDHIRQWTAFVKDNNMEHDEKKQNQQQHQHRPTVFLLLSCADLAIAGYSPRRWAELSIRMDEVCKNCSIDSWKMGSCMDNSSSDIDEGIAAKIHQSTLLQRMVQQQRHLLEDMEDAIEASFVDVISGHLGRSREKMKSR